MRGTGRVRDRRAPRYPEGHSVWSKLECPDAAERWRLADLKAWLLEAHGLKLTAWNLPCGETTDPETGEKKPVATRVYPVPEVVDLRKLPSLELSKPKAMMALTQAGIRGAPMMKFGPASAGPAGARRGELFPSRVEERSSSTRVEVRLPWVEELLPSSRGVPSAALPGT